MVCLTLGRPSSRKLSGGRTESYCRTRRYDSAGAWCASSMITMRIWSGSKRMSRLPERPSEGLDTGHDDVGVRGGPLVGLLDLDAEVRVRLADLIGSLGNQLVPMRNDQDLPVRLREGLHPRIQA